MVEIEEITDKTKGGKKDDTAKNTASTTTTTKKKRIARKDFPPIGDMLANGSPESKGRPKTFCSVFGFPIFIAICFAISLLTFHYAPHEKSVYPQGRFATRHKPREVQVPPPQQQQQPPKDDIDDTVRLEQQAKDGDGEL